MTTKESYRERQDSELDSIKAIYSDCVEDLRPPRKSEDKWLPLDIRISLTPQEDDAVVKETYTRVKLRILCPRNYPKSPPKLSLEEPKNLSDANLSELLTALNKEAYSLKGEVMIFELCQTVQSFLHDHNDPPACMTKGSFYDQMLLNEQQKRQDEINQKLLIENKNKQVMEEEVQKRREQLRKERKYRRTMSESSPLHLSTTSNEAENLSKSFSFSNQDCAEHCKSETLYFPMVGRKIQMGSCLGHSERGCINYSGIDLQNGKLCFITEWTVKYSQLQAQKKDVDDVVDELEKKVSHLASLKHKNIIAYECISCFKNKDSMNIYLVQEFLLGTSIFSLSSSLGWYSEGAGMVAKGVLEALIFLHNNGISHGNLMDSTVLMDNSGVIRVTDFSVVPYLQELVSGESCSSSDFPALGALMESLILTPNIEMRDFINKCKSERILTSSELLLHPFLFHLPNNEHSKTPDQKSFNMQPLALALADRPMSNMNVSQMSYFIPISSDQSRVQTEFEVICFIGKGAFGDVLKVRNKLDNRQYAIKRIPMTPKNKQLYRKMTREVELLSRLNHENVVRYFNSWIETSTTSAGSESGSDGEGSSIVVKHSQSHRLTANTTQHDDKSDSEDNSDDWINFAPGEDDDASDVVQFVDSNGKPVTNEDYSDEEDEIDSGTNGHQKKEKEYQYMYIQMEFCEKNTLRETIDNNLSEDRERVWKLFREIVEGLAHIHQQGMIHRDLKPVNIFLDSKDHVKIGDFGLATTSVLALQSQEACKDQKSLTYGNESMTTQVGTALYTAPEISENVNRSYNQKVDVYSLGIILFEMLSPPYPTAMERVITIQEIRTPEIVIPQYLIKSDHHKYELQVLKWLLNHDPNKRPTSAELLQSDLIPKSQMEASELQEMLRNVLANPQSRIYKHLISRCLDQESNMVNEVTYDMGTVPISAIFENAKNKIVQILRKHGAIDFTTPLLSPYLKNGSNDNVVRLMTHSGSVVCLPYDLRKPFLRHIVLNSINFLRRYSIGRVYREKKMFNCHPKQLYECAFDIVTPKRSNLIDAEVIVVAFEIISEFGFFKESSADIRINHTSLLRAIFIYCSVPTEKYKNLLTLITELLDHKLTKPKFITAMSSVLPSSRININLLIDLISVKCDVFALQNSALKVLIKGKGEPNTMANKALRELQNIATLAQAMGVTTNFEACLGLSMGQDCSKIGGVVWQIRGCLKPEKSSNKTLLVCGGRHDPMIEEIQSTNTSGYLATAREIYSTGFSIAMDKLIFSLGKMNDSNTKAVVDILVIVTGSRPPEKEVTQLLRSFWRAGLRCSLVESEAQSFDDDRAINLGAHHIVLLGEGGVLRLKTWQQDRFHEENVTRPEIIEYIKKHLTPDIVLAEPMQATPRSNSVANLTYRNPNVQSDPLPSFEIIFILQEKLTINKKKRLENQIEQKMSDVLGKFSRKELITIFAVELMTAEIKALMSCIDPIPKESTSESQSELDLVLERFPKRKRYIQEIYDDVCEKISDNKANNVALFSIYDSYYRLIL